MHLGFIGTGLMGQPMARRLLAGGHELTVFNRTEARAEPLRAAGAAAASSPAAVIEVSEAVVVMVTDADAVRATLLSDASRAVLRGRTILQMSTIGPAESVAIGREVEAAGGSYLEAPVLGSIPQASDGTLVVMVGASQELYAAWRPILDLMGSEPRLIGPVGRAAALKLALNQLIASLTASFALSLGMVLRGGVAVEQFMDILRSSALYAPTFDKKLERMLSGSYTPVNFPARHLLKDVRLCLAEGDAHGLGTAALRGIESILEKALAMGHGDHDYSALAAAVIGSHGS